MQWRAPNTNKQAKTTALIRCVTCGAMSWEGETHECEQAARPSMTGCAIGWK